jgi:hypothetical protein
MCNRSRSQRTDKKVQKKKKEQKKKNNKNEEKEDRERKGGRGLEEVSPLLSKLPKEKETFSHEVENLHKGKRQTP